MQRRMLAQTYQQPIFARYGVTGHNAYLLENISSVVLVRESRFGE